MNKITSFIQTIPKAELHLHLEGSLEPSQLFYFAKRNNIKIPYKNIYEIKNAYAFSSLQSFLDIYYQGMNVLQTKQDFYELTMAYLTRAHKDNVTHCEVFFDPQAHTKRSIPFSEVIIGINNALEEGKKLYGISSRLIMSFLRHLSEQNAIDTLNEALVYIDYIHGVGLDSTEFGNPPSKFAKVFKMAKDRGLFCTAHAGEEGPASYIRDALDTLHVGRIDHGNRCLDDDALVQRLIKEQVALTLCPLSNLKLCIINDMRDHPAKILLDKGVLATINSDDPAYFGGYINDNYIAISKALNLSLDDIAKLAKNSFKASLLDSVSKETYMNTIDKYLKDYAL